MLWRKKPVARVDIFRLVRINDRIQIEIDGRTYRSRIEDIRDGEICVAPPLWHGSPRNIWVGRILVLDIPEGGGIHRFAGTVRGMRTSQVPLLVLADFRCLGVVQRREYVRITQRVPVQFRLDERRVLAPRWFQGATHDISGGGVQIIADPCDMGPICGGDRVSVEIHLPGHKPILVKGRVARAASGDLQHASTHRFGVYYTHIAAGDRSRVVRYVLNAQAAMLVARNDMVQCTRRLPIRYWSVGDSEEENYRVAYATDMSVGGLRMTLELGEAVTIRKVLRLAIDLAGLGTVPAEAEVLWLEDGKPGAGGVQAGLGFTKIDPNAQEQITHHLATQGGTQSPSLARSA